MRLALLAKKYVLQARKLYNQVLMRTPSTKITDKSPYPEFYSVSGRKLPLKVTPNSRAKRLTLRIEAGGHGLRVTTPVNIKVDEVLYFIQIHHGWLEKKISALPAPNAAGAPSLTDGGIIPFLGEPHRIILQAGRGITKLHEEDGQKQIWVYGQEQFLARHIRDFLKKQAEQILTPMVDKHARKVARQPKSISYKDTKSRWGSCSSDRKLSFSWRIVMAPMGVIDYLTAHEVSHLVEMNHSSRFWDLCEKLCPETKQWRAWLRKNGQNLHAISFD